MSYGPPRPLTRRASSRSSLAGAGRRTSSGRLPVDKVKRSPSKKSFQLDPGSRRLRERFEQVLQARGSSGGANIDVLRQLVLEEGLPPESEFERTTCATKCTLRGRVWKVLLGLTKVDAAEYISIISRGPSKHEEKIDNDLHRTLASNKEFSSRVSQSVLCRLLNGYVNRQELSQRNKQGEESTAATYYVQGMNVLAAPFLYVMTEVDAFFAFKHFLGNNCPRYVTKSLVGVHDGHKLADMVLQVCDPQLHEFLAQQQLSAEMTLFPTILSLSVNRRPMSEVLKLWDVLLAYGVHLNIVFIVANLILIREIIFLKSPAQNQKLINAGYDLPPLKANLIVSLSMHLLRRIPGDLYAQLLLHPFHPLEGEYSIIDHQVTTSLDLLMRS
jgi:cell cycle arrest protein BUB2